MDRFLPCEFVDRRLLSAERPMIMHLSASQTPKELSRLFATPIVVSS
jgi:hypothetical protein